MRFLNYLSKSGFDDKTNNFRALDIRLICNNTPYKRIVEEVCKKNNISSTEIFSSLSRLNKELKGVYKGKYHFDFCLSEGIPLHNIKMNAKYYKKIKLLLLTTNEMLTHTKYTIESLQTPR
jgi:hypothetical protein